MKRILIALALLCAASPAYGQSNQAPAIQQLKANPSGGRAALGLAPVASSGNAADLTGALPAARLPALTGDITTTTGSATTALKALGTAGTYTKVTTDANGRVSGGASLGSSDVTGALGYTPLSTIGDASATTSIASGGSAAITNAVRFGHMVDVYDKGAKCDGVTDDTTAIQSALNTNKVVIIPPYPAVCMVTNLIVPGTPLALVPTSGFSSTGMGVIRFKAGGASSVYMVATPNWLTNVTAADNPIYCANVTFDGNSLVTNAFVDMTFGSQFSNCHFINAVHGIYETSFTANGTNLTTTRNSIQFMQSDASYNSSDGLYQDATAANPVTDVMISGGFWKHNGGYAINAASSTAGWQVGGIHTWSNTSGGFNLTKCGFATSVAFSYFEDNFNVASIDPTSKFCSIGPANNFGAVVSSQFLSNITGEVLKVFGSSFYSASSTLFQGFNGAGHMIISSGNLWLQPNYQWSGGIVSTGQIYVDGDVQISATALENGRCEIRGFMQPTANGGGQGCTDLDVAKNPAGSATSVTYSVTGVVQNIFAHGGVGYDWTGTLSISSLTTGNVQANYSAVVSAHYQRMFNTTAVNSYVDLTPGPGASGAIACSIGSAHTVVNAAGNNTETVTISCTIPAALDSESSARLTIHSVNRQVISLVIL